MKEPPNGQYRVVLWDNDGVLVDTESLFFETTRLAFARLGLALTREHWSQQYLGEGKPSREIALAMGAEEALLDTLLIERNREYRRVLAAPSTVRPGVRDVLKALQGKVRMAIVTGCDREQLDLVHSSTGLLHFFELIVTSNDCPHPKPHPELYLTALNRLGAHPSECIALEDTPRGVAAACAAGIACLAVPTELTSFLDFAGALAIEREISGLLKYLPSLG